MRYYAYPGPSLKAQIKQAPADFQVEEILPFEADGQGQHAWICLQKTSLNTQEVARRLARIAGVQERDVGYAGMKDRHAVTTQYFTVDLAGKPEPGWGILEGPEIKLITVTRHGRKLQRGALSGNRFAVRLHDLQGDMDTFTARLAHICAGGFPNDFGEQRFGHDAGNLVKAAAMLAGKFRSRDRHLTGIYLSAARSALFNAALAERVKNQNWNQVLPGEVVMLAGSQSHFLAQDADFPALHARAAALDVHPSGPLCGKGGRMPQDEAAALERSALAGWIGPEPFAESGMAWANALAKNGMEAARRPLRALPSELVWEGGEGGGWLRFLLPSGVYATSLIAELLQGEVFSG